MGHWSRVLCELDGAPTLIAEADIGRPWTFDLVAIVRDSMGYHVVSSVGCSCPSYEEQARYDDGPFESVAAALAAVPESPRQRVAEDMP